MTGFDDWYDGCDEDDAPSSRPWWPDHTPPRRLTGKGRIARTRERARLRRAKTRGIREAHRLGLRGGFVVAYPGGKGCGPTGGYGPYATWHYADSDRIIWESAPVADTSKGCLYCTATTYCYRHDPPW